jgi:DNA-binding PadR family transcriptional regulator
MSAVFSHGRLRLYLLKLLAEGPRHGYELIRLLENQFLGLYAPSAGTIYPRLQRMEADGLVNHTQAGGRKVYEITDSGRAELTARAGELASLESEINASVADLSTLANEVEQGVRGSVRDIKRELREATREARSSRPPQRDWWSQAAPPPPPAPPRANGAAGELEQKASQILDEVRRLARANKASAETLRATLVVLDGALDQVRRLLG